MSQPRGFLRLCLFLLAASFSQSAAAELYALSVDRATSTARLAEVDAASGSLTTIGTGLADMGPLAPGALAQDPVAQQLFAVGPDPTLAGRLRLYRFDLPSGNGLLIGTFGSGDRILGLHYERASQRLIALLAAADAQLRLVSIDRASAVATTINSGVRAFIDPGTAVANGSFYFVGRSTSDAASARSLYALSTSASAQTTTALAAGTRFAALVTHPVTGQLFALQQSVSVAPLVASFQLASVSPAGAITPIGAGINNCCAVALDTAAIEGDALRVVARNPTNVSISALSLLSLDLGTGTGSFSTATLPTTQTTQGLFDSNKGIANSTTTITAIVPSPVTIGQSYVVNVSVNSLASPITGTVVVTDGIGGSCNIVLPATSCSLTATQVGPLTITASYGGSPTILPSMDTENLVVNQAISSIALSSAPNPSTVTQTYAVTAVLTGFQPTGTIAVTDGLGGSCNIVIPATSCQLSGGTVGPRTLTATYPGDVNNSPAMATAMHTVIQAVTSISLSSAPNPSVVGQPYTVTAVVTGLSPTGTVAVTDGLGASCNIVLPATMCTLNSVHAGPRTLNASYSGDANNQPSSATLLHTVNRATSTTVLSANPNPVAPLAAVTLSVSVNGFGAVTGTVSISASGVPVAGCQNLPIVAGIAQCITNFSTPGQIPLLATYSGDADNLPSTGALVLGVSGSAIPALSWQAMAVLMLALSGFAAVALRSR